MSLIGANILVNGIVQGVGFRPFIHKQITDHSLCGFIRNTSRGVEIEIEGERERVDLFIDELWTHAPALAQIDEVKPVFYRELKGYTDFKILESRFQSMRDTLISPDVALCDDCRRELFDPRNRRYRYPFINCTNCGPRYTIVRDVPYDRKNTTMSAFPLCAPCDAEYHDINDRRYHAQPVCCPECGPALFFYAAGETAPSARGEEALAAAVSLLQNDGIVAVKGLGGIHLAVRAESEKAVLKLRSRKDRGQKPFALMVRDVETAREFCELTGAGESLMTGRERPIVLLKKKEKTAFAAVSENDSLGVMLPYTPLHELLLKDGPRALVMTSANPAEEPILYKNEEALSRLDGLADGFLLHDRPIESRCDDSLLWELDGGPYFARRSRGYAPRPITLPDGNEKEIPHLLALGAEQKGAFALLKDTKVFLSPYIGDMKNAAALLHYEECIRRFEKLFDCSPAALVCDLHPDYASTHYALRRARGENIPCLMVQHHHAHMAAAMADAGIRGRTIGLTWDGAGYGTDGTVWGGEFLLGDEKDFLRAASLRPFRLPGGDLAALEPWRAALSLLEDAGIKDFPLPAEEGKRQTVLAQLKAGVNTPYASSMGRLFDAVSCLLGICGEGSYEGRGAVLLESAADPSENGLLPYEIIQDDRLLFDERPMIRALCRDLEKGTAPSVLAARFMNTVIDMGLRITMRISRESGVRQVVLSGGSFQNMYMLRRLLPALRNKGLSVYHHRRVSPGDEGLVLGQLLIARERLFERKEF